MIPVIIVCSGNPFYLNKILTLVASKNQVILLGDASNQYLVKTLGIRHFNTEKWLETEYLSNLIKKFTNYSSNPLETELKSFQNFFLLYHFVKIHPTINQFVYLTHLFNNHLSNLQSKNTLLTNNSYHDTIGA